MCAEQIWGPACLADELASERLRGQVCGVLEDGGRLLALQQRP